MKEYESMKKSLLQAIADADPNTKIPISDLRQNAIETLDHFALTDQQIQELTHENEELKKDKEDLYQVILKIARVLHNWSHNKT